MEYLLNGSFQLSVRKINIQERPFGDLFCTLDQFPLFIDEGVAAGEDLLPGISGDEGFVTLQELFFPLQEPKRVFAPVTVTACGYRPIS